MAVAPLIGFKSAVVGRAEPDAGLSIALMNGPEDDPERGCVAILLCEDEAARSLAAAISAALGDAG
jgi:hypothetical protein